MKNMKAIVSVPGWAEALHDGGDGNKDDITSPALAYAYVPLIYRALRIRCDALIRPRVLLFDKSGDEVPWIFPVDPKDLLWKTEASLLLEGWNFVEKIQTKASRTTTDLKWVNPTTMDKVEYKSGKYTYRQKGNTAVWTPDSMVYMREFSITDDIQKGVSATNVALNDAALIRYMGRSVAKFFETGMMPITLLQIENLVDKDEKKRVENFFRRAASGIRNAFRVLALGNTIDTKIISQPLKDMVIPEITIQAENAIAHAFGFNPALLMQDANRATATEHRLALYQDTVEPRGDWLTEQFNRQVFEPLGYTMKLNFNELDLYQDDEKDKGAALVQITEAISKDPKAAFYTMVNILGYDLSEQQRRDYEDIFLTQMDKEPEENKALDADLDRWRRKSLNLIQKGDSPVCEFVSDHINTQMAMDIKSELEKCQTPDDVKMAFALAGGSYGIKMLLQSVNRELEALARA